LDLRTRVKELETKARRGSVMSVKPDDLDEDLNSRINEIQNQLKAYGRS
jgi:hypothetical protein